MSGHYLVLAIVGAILMSFVLTRLVERHAVFLGLVQAPNARSSHTRPTPSGGGVAAAATGIVACGILAVVGGWQFGFLAVLLAVIAALGLIDDLRDLPAKVRFLVQALVLAGLLALLSPLPSIPLLLGLSLGGAVLSALLLIVGLWWVNLFNFMDGIDGLAASQTVLILVGGSLIWWLADSSAGVEPAFALLLLVAASAGGFLLCNWPPARIFMGDAGSNFLALGIFALALMSVSSGGPGYAVWLILGGGFVTDATVTLVRRIARGEKGWVAHRRHGYQQLSRRLGHQRTTLLYAGVTLFLALPCAWLAASIEALAWPVACSFYAVLAAGMIMVRAGSASE